MATLIHTSIGPSSASMRAAAASTASGVGDVGGRHACPAPGAAHLLGGGVQPLLPAGDEADVGAARGELAHRGAADAGGGTGDRDDLPLERHPPCVPAARPL